MARSTGVQPPEFLHMHASSGRLHKTTGSGGGDVGLLIGSTVLCDFIPFSIVARGGFKGYFLFREMKCGYVIAVLVSLKTQFL